MVIFDELLYTLVCEWMHVGDVLLTVPGSVGVVIFLVLCCLNIPVDDSCGCSCVFHLLHQFIDEDCLPCIVLQGKIQKLCTKCLELIVILVDKKYHLITNCEQYIGFF